MNRASSVTALVICFLVSCVSLVGGCGGGVGSGGTGAPASVAQGTVTGFGSVIVDGVHYDDSQTVTRREDEPGVETQTEAQLGDRLELEFGSNDVATWLRVDTALVGAVSAVSTTGNVIVLGQTVVVNADPTRGPITQFSGGYTGSASIVAGDAVEVHGLIVSQGDAFTIQATRIGHLTGLPAYLRVTGIVSALSASGFNLGGLQVDASTATLLPQGPALANGQVVSVLSLGTSLTAGVAGAGHLVAAEVRIKGLAEGHQVSVGGVISSLDTSALLLQLGGRSVGYVGAVITPLGATLRVGQYVRVGGSVAADGTLQATAIDIRDGVSEPEAELSGNISGYVAATQTFMVRGVAVDAGHTVPEGCPSTGLANELYVHVTGALGKTGVIATSVRCEMESPGATIQRSGVASAVDTTATSFVLSASSGTSIAVSWNAITFFNGVSPALLAGKRVEVQGEFLNGVLVAQKIRIDD